MMEHCRQNASETARMVGGERSTARGVAQSQTREGRWEGSLLTYIREETRRLQGFYTGVSILDFLYILCKQRKSLREIIKSLHYVTMEAWALTAYIACISTEWVWRRHLVPT